jgi:hypothetical protein
VQAALFYTPDMDGLLHPWKGRVFLNPPWGDAQAASVKERAITKALAEYKAGNMSECVIVLNANATTTAWFAPLFQFPMCFPPQRIKHLQPGDHTGQPTQRHRAGVLGGPPRRILSGVQRAGCDNRALPRANRGSNRTTLGYSPLSWGRDKPDPLHTQGEKCPPPHGT